MKINDIYGDFKIIDIEKKHPNPHCTTKCNICGREQTLLQNAVRKRNNSHGNICSKLIIKEKFNSKSHNSQFYRIWCNMRTRTTNKNYEKRKNYSEKGINSDDFQYFVDFFDSMFESYSEHISKFGENDTTLDRIDNSKSYTKENCKWSTWNEQADNKTSNLSYKVTDPNGQIYIGKNLKKFCEENNLSYQNAISGIHQNNKSWKNGWFFEIV